MRPPACNTGGTSHQEPSKRVSPFEDVTGAELLQRHQRGLDFRAAGTDVEPPRLVLDGREVKIDPRRAPVEGQSCRVDTVHWVIHEDFYYRRFPSVPFGDLVRRVSDELMTVFHFPITKQRKSGLYSYKECYEVGKGCGLVALVGNASTVYHQVQGQGALVAADGWERRLSDVLHESRLYGGHLTRIDICLDLYEPKEDIRWFFREVEAGALKSQFHIKRSRVQTRGDWSDPDYTQGLTFYYGSRQSGLLLRVYEKGREQGDETDPWIRIEAEFNAGGFVLHSEMLTDPSGFFFGQFPWFSQFADWQGSFSKAQRVGKSGLMDLEKCVKTLRTQYGRHIACLRKFFDDAELLDKIQNDDGRWPERLERFDMLSRRATGQEVKFSAFTEAPVSQGLEPVQHFESLLQGD